METIATRVAERVDTTNAWRAQFLGSAFALTFLLSGLGDAASMGTLENHAFMFGQLFACLAVVAVVRWTRLGRRFAGTAISVGIAVTSASGAAHLSQFGGLDGPWFYGCYVAPPIFIAILLPLWLRAVVTFGTSVSYVAIYALCRPDLFTHPMAHIPMLYLLMVSSISVGIGHYVYRLEVESFADAARLESAAAVLEAQLRLGDGAPTHLRREIARQLHDDVAQLITGARIQLDGWKQGHGSESPAGRLAELLDELARRARRMLHELREPPARGPLLAELERLRTEYAELGLTVDLVVDDGGQSVVPEPAQVDVLVSSAREALTNAVRHGKASEATVSVHAEPLVIELLIMDNGGGRADAVREGYGLLGIRERAEGLGGSAELGDYEEGLRLSVTLPRARVA